MFLFLLLLFSFARSSTAANKMLVDGDMKSLQRKLLVELEDLVLVTNKKFESYAENMNAFESNNIKQAELLDVIYKNAFDLIHLLGNSYVSLRMLTAEGPSLLEEDNSLETVNLMAEAVIMFGNKVRSLMEIIVASTDELLEDSGRENSKTSVVWNSLLAGQRSFNDLKDRWIKLIETEIRLSSFMMTILNCEPLVEPKYSGAQSTDLLREASELYVEGEERIEKFMKYILEAKSFIKSNQSDENLSTLAEGLDNEISFRLKEYAIKKPPTNVFDFSRELVELLRSAHLKLTELLGAPIWTRQTKDSEIWAKAKRMEIFLHEHYLKWQFIMDKVAELISGRIGEVENLINQVGQDLKKSIDSSEIKSPELSLSVTAWERVTAVLDSIVKDWKDLESGVQIGTGEVGVLIPVSRS